MYSALWICLLYRDRGTVGAESLPDSWPGVYPRSISRHVHHRPSSCLNGSALRQPQRSDVCRAQVRISDPV